jgi:pyridoxal biosynthesis lyase PdxS
MAQNGTTSNDFTVKAGLAQMLKGGVIMDVVNAEQVWFDCDQLVSYSIAHLFYL